MKGRWWRGRGGAVDVGGDVGYSAVGPHSSVVVHQAAARGEEAVAWPLERTLGPEHFDTVMYRESLARRRAAARPFWRRVLGR